MQKRHQVRSARVRRHTVFDNLAPLAEHSADILVPPHRQTPTKCGLFRSHLLVICTAKPRYTAASAREHRRVLAPRLSTPQTKVTSPLHTPERYSLRCVSAASSWPALVRSAGGRESDGEAFARVSLRVCVCARAFGTCAHIQSLLIQSHSCLCVRFSSR
jgi:hypothetical protein